MQMSSPSAIDVDQFKQTVGRFATGVAVVTGSTAAGPVGITCQSFASLSLDPPLVLFCPGTGSYAWSQIRDAGNFCVNLLSDDQRDLCMRFASKIDDRFDGVPWTPSDTGAPILDGALSWIDCRIADVHPGGDHVIVVGEVIAVGPPDSPVSDDPLIYYRGAFGRFVEEDAT